MDKSQHGHGAAAAIAARRRSAGSDPCVDWALLRILENKRGGVFAPVPVPVAIAIPTYRRSPVDGQRQIASLPLPL